MRIAALPFEYCRLIFGTSTVQVAPESHGEERVAVVEGAKA